MKKKQPNYLTWMHKVTVLGYDENIMIMQESAQVLEVMHKQGHSPQQALEELKKIYTRVNAINQAEAPPTDDKN